MTVLAEEFDVLLLDLDGTIYLGHQVIEHASEAVAEAARRGARPMFVTNNASRSPADVADSLTGMGVPAVADDVLTSPEAAAAMLAGSHPAGSKVLVVGAPALADAVSAVGLVPVRLVTDEPEAVVQGHSPDTGWRDLAEACIAIRQGVDWVACNTDATLPTDRGLLPGNGAMVQALIAATGLQPRVAGKPNRPLLDEGVRRSGGKKPLVVGDRLDTDIEAGVTASMPSLLVLSGVSTATDLLAAPVSQRPTHLAKDLRGLVESGRAVAIADVDSGGPWLVSVDDAGLRLRRADGPHEQADPEETEETEATGKTGRTGRTEEAGRTDWSDLQALALLAAAAWTTGKTTVTATDDDVAAATLHRLGLSS